MKSKTIGLFLVFVGIAVASASAAGITPFAILSPTSWNPRVSCIPSVVNVESITVNQVGSASLTNSPYNPGITSPVGDAKRWLTSGNTPSGWTSPGPPCSITNSHGSTIVSFVEIDGVKLGGRSWEDCRNSYDQVNGGSSFGSRTYAGCDNSGNVCDASIATTTCDALCGSVTDPTCPALIHVEIDGDWIVAGYCSHGTFCDNSTIAQAQSANQLVDVQGFVYWDSYHCCGSNAAQWHSFNGWELHPLTAWKLHGSTVSSCSASFSWAPTSPSPGQAITFVSNTNCVAPSSYTWVWGDGTIATMTTVATSSHIYANSGSYTAVLQVNNATGVAATTTNVIAVCSGTACNSQPDFIGYLTAHPFVLVGLGFVVGGGIESRRKDKRKRVLF